MSCRTQCSKTGGWRRTNSGAASTRVSQCPPILACILSNSVLRTDSSKKRSPHSSFASSAFYQPSRILTHLLRAARRAVSPLPPPWPRSRPMRPSPTRGATPRTNATCCSAGSAFVSWPTCSRPSHVAAATTMRMWVCGPSGSTPYASYLEDLPRPLTDNEAVRERICQRCYHFNGRRYTTDEMYNMLLHSTLRFLLMLVSLLETSWLMKTHQITGIIDWECAGWSPD